MPAVCERQSQLFRSEALAARGDTLEELIASVPRGFASYALAVLTVFVLSVLLLGSMEYSEKLTVDGITRHTNAPVIVVAQRAGYLKEHRVRRGDEVVTGDVIAIVDGREWDPAAIDHPVLLAQKANLEKRLEATRELDVLDFSRLKSEAEDLKAIATGLARELDISSKHSRLVAAKLDRVQTLSLGGSVPWVQRQQVFGQWLERRRDEASLRRGVLENGRRLRDLDAELRAFDPRRSLQQLALEAQLSELQGRIHRIEQSASIPVIATATGLISDLYAEEGQSLREGAPLMSIGGHGQAREIELWLTSDVVGRVVEGMHVSLRYAGYPFQEYGVVDGRVRHVSNVRHQPGTAGVSRERGVFRAYVDVDFVPVQFEAIPPGMRIEADLLLERRPLAIWLIKPVLANFLRL